jgi:hypothetical protein
VRPAEARSLLRRSIRDNDNGDLFSPARLLLVHHLAQSLPGTSRSFIRHQVLLAHAGSPAAWIWITEALSTVKV